MAQMLNQKNRDTTSYLYKDNKTKNGEKSGRKMNYLEVQKLHDSSYWLYFTMN